jgi:hypothetical protein
LGASVIEGAGAVDGVGGVAEFFVNGKLGGNAAAGFDFAHAAGKEAFQLLRRSTECDDESIEVFGEAGFDEESGFDEGGVAKAGTFPGVELEEHGLLDAGMENGVEASEFVGISESDGGEFAAVDAAGPVGDVGAEFAKDFVVSSLAGFHEPVRDGIGIEDGEAEFAKHGGNGTLAAGDAAG